MMVKKETPPGTVTYSRDSLPLLVEADQLINGQRQADYGDKLTNFSQMAMLINGTLAHKLLPGALITPEDAALIMMQVKVSRLAKSPNHRDTILDIAGYAGCYAKLQEERLEGVTLPGALTDNGCPF
jgi:Domain of unknown function (DUF6378)